MTRILLLTVAILLFEFSGSNAQGIDNDAFCTVEVTIKCYSGPPGCALVSSNMYVVAPGAYVPFAPCSKFSETVAEVRWQSPCPPTTVTVGAPGNCAGFPNGAALPPCNNCTTFPDQHADVHWAGTNLRIIP